MFCEYLHNSSRIDGMVRLGLVLGPSSARKSIATPLNSETICGWRAFLNLFSSGSLLDTSVHVLHVGRGRSASSLESRDPFRLILDISDATN
jgi:hypothetical protein